MDVLGDRLLVTATFPADGPSPLHDLARAFRSGDREAFDRVLALALIAFGGTGGLLDPAGREPVAGVALPGHLAGAENEPVMALLEAVAGRLPRLGPVARALVRTVDGPAARSAEGRDPLLEAQTLAWRPERLPRHGPILLLDDVVRSGGSLTAAVLAAPPSVAGRLVPAALFRATE